MATVRDEKTGEKTETTISAAQLLQNINYDVQNAGNFVGDEETDKFVLQDKAEAFRKYLYLYFRRNKLRALLCFAKCYRKEVFAGFLLSGGQ